MPQSPSPRNAIPFFVLSFFLVYIFSVGVRHELSGDIPSAVFMKGSGLSTRHRPSLILPHSASGFPDFGNYRRVATLSAEQLSLGCLALPLQRDKLTALTLR
jgi:hypothetical protein